MMKKILNKIKVRKLKRISQNFLIFVIIFSWVFSPIVPAIKFPTSNSNELIKIGIETKQAYAAYGNGYSYRRTITIDPTKVSGASNFTNFPVLVSLTDATLKITGNGGNVTDNQGDDIIFTSDSAGSTALDYERERYSSTTGELNAWVEVPTLDTTSNTVIYMFYGKASVTTSQENITGTWDTNYKEVMHFSEYSGQHQDSTVNNNDSTAVTLNNMGTANGKIAGADDFNGTSNSVTINDAASLDIANTGTIEAWMRTDSVSTTEANNAGLWKTVATTTLTGSGDADYSSVDSVIVGEKIYYGAILCSDATEVFYTATSTLDGQNFSVWKSRTAPSGCTNSTGGASIGVDSDGQYIWYAFMGNDGQASAIATTSYATTTLDLTTGMLFSGWKDLTPNIAIGQESAAEGSGIDIVVAGDKVYFGALTLSAATENFFTGSIKLNGSSWTGWTDQTTAPDGGGAGESCGVSVNTDSTKLYYSSSCFSTATSNFERSSSELDGTQMKTWSVDTSPTGGAANNFGFNDSTLVGGYSYHVSFLHSGATPEVTTYQAASSSPEGGSVTTWRSIKSSNGDPDGSGLNETTDPSVESDGKNLFYSAFAHDSTRTSFFIASSTLPAHPFVSKRDAYELIQTGKGYAFDWAGKPTTFGTTTAVSTFEHVVVTQDGSIMNYYKNGVLMGSTTVSTDFLSNANNLLIGSGFRSVGTQIYFDGIIDEVRISDTARSADFVATEYNNQNSTSTFYTISNQEQADTSVAQIYSAQNERFAIGQATTAISPITVTDGATPAITLANDLLIAIATTSGFLMEWDTTDLTAVISGGASGKVSTTVSYLGNSILKINVTSDFIALDSITISGLSYKNFTAPGKSGTGALVAYAGATTGTSALATSSTIITIGTGNSSGSSALRGSKFSKPPNYLRTNTGLIVYHTYDGTDMTQNIADLSGQGNIGVLAGVTSTSTAPGKIGQAIDLIGTSDAHYNMVNDVISTGAITLSTWIKPRTIGASSFGTILSNNKYLCYFNNARTLACSNDSGVTVAVTASNVVPLNQWTHFVAVRNSSGQFTFYLNGEISGTANQAGGTTAAGSDLEVGHNWAGTNAWDGLLDDFRIYNRALTVEEIGFLSRAGQSKISIVSPSGALSNGLVGYWTFDGKNLYQNLQDVSGNGNHGRLLNATVGHNATSTMTVPGRIGQGLDFDGTDDSVAIGQLSSLTIKNFTVTVWFKREGAGTTVSTGTGGQTAEPIVAKLVGESETENLNGNFFIGIDQSTLAIAVDFEKDSTSNIGGAPTGFNAPIDGVTAITNNTWNHVAYVVDTANMYIYLNGSLDASISTTSQPQSPSDQYLCFARACNSSGAPTGAFNGVVDEVRIYNRVLSATEILQLYKSGQAKSKP